MIITNPVYKICSILFLVTLLACNSQETIPDSDTGEKFSFVFITDIHLQPELNAQEGFKQAIDTVNKLKPDFVITGGDLIMDALGQNFEKADSLYNLYLSAEEDFKMPVYNTMGNHEIFGIYSSSGVDSTHPFYGEKLFEKKIGRRYYSFDHKGWHFIILDGIEDTGHDRYIGKIDSLQMVWIKSDLEKVDPSTPIVVSTHIPLLTVMTQWEEGALAPNGKATVINNSRQVLALFDRHNLKLVLQGHLHYFEDIYVEGIHFITGGAVSGSWWKGPYMGVEEGFLKINITGDSFNWEYIDYGWDPQSQQKN